MDEYRKLTLQRRAAIEEELRGYEIAMDQIAVKRSLALARLGELDWRRYTSHRSVYRWYDVASRSAP